MYISISTKILIMFLSLGWYLEYLWPLNKSMAGGAVLRYHVAAGGARRFRIYHTACTCQFLCLKYCYILAAHHWYF